jgi:hypothetical protein
VLSAGTARTSIIAAIDVVRIFFISVHLMGYRKHTCRRVCTGMPQVGKYSAIKQMFPLVVSES